LDPDGLLFVQLACGRFLKIRWGIFEATLGHELGRLFKVRSPEQLDQIWGSSD